jgi:hypothetical protein
VYYVYANTNILSVKNVTNTLTGATNIADGSMKNLTIELKGIH